MVVSQGPLDFIYLPNELKLDLDSCYENMYSSVHIFRDEIHDVMLTANVQLA